MELLIAETAGEGRSITLKGRSMPQTNEAPPNFGLQQRGRINYPPSNPQADVALLGAVWKPTAFQGVWDDKFFSPIDAPRLVGFKKLGSRVGNVVVPSGDNARRSIEVVEAFMLMCRVGQKMRVEWGPIVRYGILWDMDLSPITQQHWIWSMNFEWTGDSNVRPIIRKPTKINARSLFALLLALLEAIRKGIALLNAFANFYAARIKAPLDALTNAIVGCMEELTKVIANAVTPQKILGDLKANLTKIKLAARDLLRAIKGLVNFSGPTTKRDADTANYAIFVISKEAIRIAANMAEREQELERLATPEVQDEVVISDGQTLRDIAQRFYGAAADWIFLADFNSLPCSPPVGTVVLVPYRKT